jgi:hypothetical protein
MDKDWTIVGEREGVGRLDTWQEFLCIKRSEASDVFDLGIFRHELVAEIPSTWFDDDGNPLPEYSDEQGYLSVPDYYGGRAVTGHDGEYLLGDLVWDETYGPMQELKSVLKSEVTAVLENMEWRAPDLDKLLSVIIDAVKAL